tara:strand:- start:49 stop:1548 length:1500 start_codon:yes stop_codon:yes gene_type:complete
MTYIKNINYTVSKKVKQYTIKLPCKFNKLLRKINSTALGVIFVVTKNNIIFGSISDGDIRRYLLNKNLDIIDYKSNLIKKNPVTASINEDKKNILKLLDPTLNKVRINCLPLINSQKKIVDFASIYDLGRIPLLSPQISLEEKNNVMNCLNTGWISSVGNYVEKFEKEFTKYLGGGYALSVTNGTTALELAIRSLGIGKGDEILLPNFTFAATINAVINSKATPKLIDINRKTWTIDLDQIKKNITKKTKAIMPVHVYGQSAHSDEINKIANKYNILVIEDCAEALGGIYKNKLIGLNGDCSTFSFYPNKIITTGEGGMVVFNNKKIYEKAKKLRNQGRSTTKVFWHDYAGYNFRMTNIQAAIGLAQLKRINNFMKLRTQIFKIYDNFFKKHKEIELLPKNKWSKNSLWLYTILIKSLNEKKRDKLIKSLSSLGIETRPGFYPLNTMKPYKKFSTGIYPVTNRISYISLSLPSTPTLKKSEIYYIYRNVILEKNKLEKL